jgi:hypothetical protein
MLLSPVDGPLSPEAFRRGSMSSDERNEVLSNSGFVDEMVTKASKRLFCEALGVPFRSRICTFRCSVSSNKKMHFMAPSGN